VRGSLKIHYSGPEAKGPEPTVIASTVDASGTTCRVSDGKVEKDKTKPDPDYSCCESNIAISPAAEPTAKGKSATADLNTRREVTIEFLVPITWSCERIPDQKCIGRLNAAVTQNPNMFNQGTQGFTTPPLSATVRTESLVKKCDGKEHKGFVRIIYKAVYPGIAHVQGAIGISLSVPPNKGAVATVLTGNVTAGGNQARVADLTIDQ
jgi:hypothetical protein